MEVNYYSPFLVSNLEINIKSPEVLLHIAQ